MKRTISLLILFGCLAFVVVRFNAAGSSANTQQPQHTEIKIDPKLFDEFVGQYGFIVNPDSVLSFVRDGEKFFILAPGQGKAEVFPESLTTFFLKVAPVQTTFVRDAQGKVSG